MIKTDIRIVKHPQYSDKYEIELKFKYSASTIYFTTNDAFTKREADVRVIELAAEYKFNTLGIIVQSKA